MSSDGIKKQQFDTFLPYPALVESLGMNKAADLQSLKS